jgi:GDPmannose 4,6-dehydratase
MAAAKIKLGLQDKLYLGNLDAVRDWGFAGDYVEAMWLMLQQEKADDYVIATGKAYSIRNCLNLVFEHAGLSVSKCLDIDSRLFRPHEVPYLLGDSSKANRILNWQPKTDLKSLAAMMYEEDLKKYYDISNRI